MWKFKKKMNGVHFTFLNENHELVLVLVHNFSMNGRSPIFSQPQERTKNFGFFITKCLVLFDQNFLVLFIVILKYQDYLFPIFHETTTPWFKWTAGHLTRSPNFERRSRIRFTAWQWTPFTYTFTISECRSESNSYERRFSPPLRKKTCQNIILT